MTHSEKYMTDAIGLKETAQAFTGGNDAQLPDIVPLEKKDKFLTPKRLGALAKARKAKEHKKIAREMNKGRAKRALQGVKLMFASLKKKSQGPPPVKVESSTPEGTVFAAPQTHQEVKAIEARAHTRLLGGPKLRF